MLETHLALIARVSEAGNVTVAAAVTAGLWLWLGAVWLGLRLSRKFLPPPRRTDQDETP